MTLNLKVLVTSPTLSEKYVTETLSSNPAIGELVYVPHNGTLPAKQLAELITKHQPNIILAGHEQYTTDIISLCENLRMISRIGSGTENIFMPACHDLSIHVTDTANAATQAVAEMTLAQMIMLLRKLPQANQAFNQGKWHKPVGKDLGSCFIGIIGYGRIGHALQNMLTAFTPVVFVDDIDSNRLQHARDRGCNVATKEYIFSACDVISIHTPLTDASRNMITRKQLSVMKNDVVLINNAHPEIINETDLYSFLINNQNASVSMDVHQQSSLPFITQPNAFLTPGIGNSSKLSLQAMEKGAIDNVLQFVNQMQNEITFLNKI